MLGECWIGAAAFTQNLTYYTETVIDEPFASKFILQIHIQLSYKQSQCII